MEIFKEKMEITSLFRMLILSVLGIFISAINVQAAPPSIDETGGYFDGKTYRCAKEPCFSVMKQEASRKRRPFDPNDWPYWIDKEKDESYRHCLDQFQRSLARFSETKPTHVDGDRCKPVTGGLWRDVYSGQKFEDISLVDVDHVVSPEEAHSFGAYVWNPSKRKRFANSSKNVIVVSKEQKRQRAGRSPMEWMPPFQRYWCDYVVQREIVAREFSLKFPVLVDNLHKKLKTLYCKF